MTLNILGDLFDTPPSRASVRKPPPKKRMQRKRYSAPCNMQSELSEGGLRKGPMDRGLRKGPVDRVLQLSPAEGLSPNLSMGFTPHGEGSEVNNSLELVHREPDSKGAEPEGGHSQHGGDMTDTRSGEGEDTKCPSPKPTPCGNAGDGECHTVEGNSLHKEQSDDLMFTQLSPSALEAIYEVVDETENATKKQAVAESLLNTDTSGTCKVLRTERGESLQPLSKPNITKTQSLQPLSKPNITKTQSDGSQTKDVSSKVCDVESITHNESPKDRICDDLFSQLSPRALHSIMTESEQVEKLTKQANSRSKNSPILIKKAIKEDADSPCGRPSRGSPVGRHNAVVKASPKGSPKLLPKPPSVSRPVGLGRKAKRFSYPSTSQISSVCPKLCLAFSLRRRPTQASS